MSKPHKIAETLAHSISIYIELGGGGGGVLSPFEKKPLLNDKLLNVNVNKKNYKKGKHKIKTKSKYKNCTKH